MAEGLHTVAKQRKITLVDEEKKLIVTRLDIPESQYDTLKSLKEREISYAEITHSSNPLPDSSRDLEILRFEFDRKSNDEISQMSKAKIPRGTKDAVVEAMKEFYPDFNFGEIDKILQLFRHNNETYVRVSPFERIARILWLYQQGKQHDGLYLDVEETEQVTRYKESRLLFSVGNPEQRGFLTQVSEVFQRLNIGVRRSYSLIINTGVQTPSRSIGSLSTSFTENLTISSFQFRQIFSSPAVADLKPFRQFVYFLSSPS